MSNEKKNFFDFLKSMFKIGCIGFGGGSVLIPVIEEEIINQKKLDSKKEYDKDVIVASITPGALPVEIAGSLGRRNFGIKGMVFGSSIMAFPGVFLTIILLTVLYFAKEEVLKVFDFVSLGITAFVLLLLVKYIAQVQHSFYEKGKKHLYKSLFVTLAVFFMVSGKNMYALFQIEGTPILSISTFKLLLVVFFFAFYTRGTYSLTHMTIAGILSAVFLLGHGKAQLISNDSVIKVCEIIMIILSIYGIVNSFKKQNVKTSIEKDKMYKDLLIWGSLLVIVCMIGVFFDAGAMEYIKNACLSVLMSFGGGDAYLTVANGLFVENSMITEAQYFGSLVTVVNVLPGSILCKTLSGIGYYYGLNQGLSVAGGLLFAGIGFVCSVAMSCGFYCLIYYLYDSLIQLKIFQTISNWIRPIIAGLLLNIILSLIVQCAALGEKYAMNNVFVFGGISLLFLVDLLLARFGKNKTTYIIGMNLLLAFVAYIFWG